MVRPKRLGAYVLTREWTVAAVIVAVPFLALGLIELISFIRRRRRQAIAQRLKGAPPRRSGPLDGASRAK
jgi:hypothetical protein